MFSCDEATGVCSAPKIEIFETAPCAEPADDAAAAAGVAVAEPAAARCAVDPAAAARRAAAVAASAPEFRTVRVALSEAACGAALLSRRSLIGAVATVVRDFETRVRDPPEAA